MDTAHGANGDGSEASRDPRICQPNLQVFTEQDYEGENLMHGIIKLKFAGNSWSNSLSIVKLIIKTKQVIERFLWASRQAFDDTDATNITTITSKTVKNHQSSIDQVSIYLCV